MIVGVDGCEDGWMAAIDDESGSISLRVASTMDELIGQLNASLFVVDIPIGLLDVSPREADRAARRLLKGRTSCVFNAPIRPIIGASDYFEANRLSRQLDGKGVSRQGFSLIPKIVEIDEMVRSGDLRTRIVEGHPEVSFAVMKGNTPVMLSNHTKEGQHIRQALLESALKTEAVGLVSSLRRSHQGDAVDALAMLWTARRVRDGEAVRFPDGPAQRDACGIEAAITA